MESYNLSHWEWDSFFKNIDCIVIGSGIVGLSAAIRLKTQSPKLSVIVLERGSLPIGASTRNAGFACFGSLSELLEDLQHSSRDEVLSLVEQRYKGLQLLRQRYSDAAIGYEPLGGFEVFRYSDHELYQNCLNQMDVFNKELEAMTQMTTYAKADQKITKNGLEGIAYMIHNQAEGQIHTGQLMRTLLQEAQSLGIQCLGGITVEKITEANQKVYLQTDKGWEIAANKVLMATNGFAKQLLSDLEIAPARNHILITKPIENLKLKGSFHYDKGYVYFRNVGNRVLLGGGRNLDTKTEQTATFGEHTEIRTHLENLLHQIILPNQNIKIDRWWSGIMGVGTKKEPILKTIGQNIVVAVRLGGMGVALGTGVGEAAAEILLS